MSSQKNKKTNEEWIGRLGIVIIIVLCSLFLWTMSYLNKQDMKYQDEAYEFYKENCPKLNSTLVEREEGYRYTGRCFKELEGDIKYYWITKVNERNYLKEIT